MIWKEFDRRVVPKISSQYRSSQKAAKEKAIKKERDNFASQMKRAHKQTVQKMATLLAQQLVKLSPALKGLVYIGNLNTNQFDPDSVHNKFGTYGNPYSSLSINNEYGQYGSPYSLYSANNPHTLQAPRLYDSSGNFLGRLSANKFDIYSVTNPGSIYRAKFLNAYGVGVIKIYGEL